MKEVKPSIQNAQNQMPLGWLVMILSASQHAGYDAHKQQVDRMMVRMTNDRKAHTPRAAANSLPHSTAYNSRSRDSTDRKLSDVDVNPAIQ